jgi:transglutaminase-like putative cysteine protease
VTPPDVDRIRYRVIHETSYRYAATVANARHLAHLSPRRTYWQRVIEHRLAISPEPTELFEHDDFFGNGQTQFALERDHDDLVVRADSVVEVERRRRDVADTPWEDALCETTTGPAEFELAQFRTGSPAAAPLGAALDYARRSFAPGRPWLEAMLDLTCRIKRDFAYDPTATTVGTPVSEVLEHRRGVCQDFAHLMISCLRSLKLPARYVSGYVLTRRPGDPLALAGADASHAWVSSHLPGVGWVDFDPTNGKIADIEFVTLGWGREFSDVTPLRGVVLGGGEQELAVSVSVLPLIEADRKRDAGVPVDAERHGRTDVADRDAGPDADREAARDDRTGGQTNGADGAGRRGKTRTGDGA